MPPRNAMPGTDGFDFGSSLVWTLEFLAWQRTEILAEFRWAAWGWWDDAPAGPQDHPPVKLHKASFYEMIRGDFLGSAHLLSVYFKGDSFGCIMFFCLGGGVLFPEARNSLLLLNLVVWIPNFIDFQISFAFYHQRGIFLRWVEWTYAVLKGHHVSALSQEDLFTPRSMRFGSCLSVK